MATIDPPSTGLFAAVLHAFRRADPRNTTVSGAVISVIDSLNDEEAQKLPIAIQGVLPLLRGDVDRLRFAAEVLVRFDMFEAAEALTRLALDINDHELLLSAASLAGNPGVDASLRQYLAQALQDDRGGQIRLYGRSIPLFRANPAFGWLQLEASPFWCRTPTF